MKIIRTVLLTIAAGLCLVATALAADIRITVNAADKTMTMSSLLGVPVHVMGLVSPSGYYGASVDIPPQGTATVSITGELPPGIDSARCNAGPDGIPGLTPAPEGFYLVSAAVQ